jgi:hypothetical protein
LESETDYLVIGGGASGMSFVDLMLQETDATFTVVDRRPVPGGHWNDAYPFVRLHQPASFYGVSSRSLGNDKIETTGLNKGFWDLASGVEITNYYHQLMEEVFLPSGRVSFFPLCEYQGGSEFVSRFSGETHSVKINKKLVDATHLTTSIPLTHKRKFEVDSDVTCVPPNDLPRLAPDHRHITMVGSGKTAMDSVLWLLSNGYPADAISWVMPRDSWMFNRANAQPGALHLANTLDGRANMLEVVANSESADDLSKRLGECGFWLQLDENVWPTMFHGATVTELDVEQMTRIADVIRLGHVTRIESGKIVLTKGEVESQPDTLYVDCTASAVAENIDDQTLVFSPDKISLQMIRTFQPCFSAALIGHIEATIEDEDRKHQLTRPTPMVDTPEDWFKRLSTDMMNGFFWTQDEEISAWIRQSRLDGFSRDVAEIAPESPELQAILKRLEKHGPAALQNLQRLNLVEATT